jgi:predicted RNA-binding Zn ribbon-like protein
MESDAPEVTEKPAFELSGGQPALNLVNTLDNRFAPAGPLELLREYGDLVRFAEQNGLLGASGAGRLGAVGAAAGQAALERTLELREALAATLYRSLAASAPRRRDLRLLEESFHEAARHRALHWRQEAGRATPFKWRWPTGDRCAELPFWMLAHAAAELIVSPAMQQLRACGADTCRWLFLDTSKNHTRRWCNMKICGNRTKARRFQARRAELSD